MKVYVVYHGTSRDWIRASSYEKALELKKDLELKGIKVSCIEEKEVGVGDMGSWEQGSSLFDAFQA